MTAAVRNSQSCWLPIIAYGEDTHASATKPDARLFRKPTLDRILCCRRSGVRITLPAVGSLHLESRLSRQAIGSAAVRTLGRKVARSRGCSYAPLMEQRYGSKRSKCAPTHKAAASAALCFVGTGSNVVHPASPDFDIPSPSADDELCAVPAGLKVEKSSGAAASPCSLCTCCRSTLWFRCRRTCL